MNANASVRFVILSAFILLVSMDLHAQGSLRGHVYCKSAKREMIEVDTLRVYLKPQTADTLFLTTYDSRFQFDNLTPGEYMLICHSSRYGTDRRKIIIHADFISFVDVNLAHSGKRRKRL